MIIQNIQKWIIDEAFSMLDELLLNLAIEIHDILKIKYPNYKYYRIKLSSGQN